MKTFLKIVGVLVLAFVLYISYMIAFPVSPKETVTYSSEISDFEVVYSRPFKKGRLVFGPEKDGALVPFRNYWRTGANAATKLYKVVENTERILAIELLNACQAISFREKKSSDFIENIIDIFRDEVAFLDKDRLLHDDIEDAIIFLQNLSVDFEIL